MASPFQSRHLAEIMDRRKAAAAVPENEPGGVQQFVLPPSAEQPDAGGEPTEDWHPAHEQGASEPKRRVSRGRRLAAHLAYGPQGAQAMFEREAQRLESSRDRTLARQEASKLRFMQRQEKLADEAADIKQRTEEGFWKFGREKYKESGDINDLYPDDPMKAKMGLRGTVKRKEGLELGETWKSPTGEDWYGAPTGKPVRSRAEKGPGGPSEFTVQEKAYKEELRLSDIHARIRDDERMANNPEELQKYQRLLDAEMALDEPNPDNVFKYRYVISATDRVLRLKKKAQIVADRLKQIRSSVGQGGTGVSDDVEDDDDDTGPDPSIPEPPMPRHNESAEGYHRRLEAMGFSEEQADIATADAIEMGLVPPGFPAEGQ